MKNFSLFLLSSAALLAVACGSGSSVSGTVSGASESQLVVKLLDVNVLSVLDTVKTAKDGSFKFTVPVAEGDPEFVYLYYKDTKVASLLLEDGDKVSVETDTLGRYSVKGSENCTKLQEVETRFARFSNEIMQVENNAEFVRKYVAYYRESVRYVMSNPYSLTVIPVLYENIGGYAPVFSQSTDALHFRNAYDSLMTVYPESRYVKALEKETIRRETALRLENDLKNSPSIGYLDLNMPDVNGVQTALSSVKAKVILLHFWDSSDAVQNMFGKEVLLPIYEDFHSKGFEIYSVCLDVDKARWASVVKGQNLPWINVNDGLGAASKAVASYNVTSLPMSVIIADGNIITSSIEGAAGLRKELSRLLK